jgi:hypothetical protein
MKPKTIAKRKSNDFKKTRIVAENKRTRAGMIFKNKSTKTVATAFSPFNLSNLDIRYALKGSPPAIPMGVRLFTIKPMKDTCRTCENDAPYLLIIRYHLSDIRKKIRNCKSKSKANASIPIFEKIINNSPKSATKKSEAIRNKLTMKRAALFLYMQEISDSRIKKTVLEV